MSRLISNLPLPHFLKKVLKDKEYETVNDLARVTASELALELSIGVAQAEDILRQAESYQAGPLRPAEPVLRGSQLHSTTAAELLHSVNRIRYSTFSAALDDLIANFAPPRPQEQSSQLYLKGKKRQLIPGIAAISPGMVIELSGPPGGGKTCISIASAISARLGDGGEEDGDREHPEVLMIDTEGSITGDRMRLAIEAMIEEGGINATIQDVLDGIHYTRVPTQVQMVGFLHILDEWLELHPKVKLVVMDTLSYHFRQPTLEHGSRKRVMELAKKVIGQAATVHGCAVVITTQLATKLLTAENKPAKFETSDRAVLMPQLGDAWTTERTIRIMLFRGGASDDLRYAYASTLGTASSNPELEEEIQWASFDIDNVGLPCDVPAVPEDSTTPMSH